MEPEDAHQRPWQRAGWEAGMSETETLIRGLTADVRHEIDEAARGIGVLENRVTALRLALCAMHRVPRAEEVVDACAAAWGVTAAAIRGKGRPESIIAPRQAAMYLMRASDMTFPVIGRALLRDHGTVIYGCRVVEDRLATDPKFSAKLIEVANQLGIGLPKKVVDSQAKI